MAPSYFVFFWFSFALLRATSAGFIEGAPCSIRNTAYLTQFTLKLPINETKCVDISLAGNTSDWLANSGLLSVVKYADTLYANDLNFTKFPEWIVRKLPLLTLLDFSGNNIRRLPLDMNEVAPKMTHLLLPDNAIFISKKRPLFKSSSIRILMLSRNRIRHIYPVTFSQMPALEVLHLDGNKLQYFDGNAIHPGLVYLDMTGNAIIRVPPIQELPSSVRFYIINGQKIKRRRIIKRQGYSAAALLAILFALPFAWRVLVHREHGHWENPIPAHYFAHLELFLGNGCLGVGVMMLLALTLERYVSVCHPGHARPLLGSPIRAVILIPILTFLLYIPIMFRSFVKTCRLLPEGQLIYQRTENTNFITHPVYSVYKVVLELIFKVVPVVLLAALNLRILIVYRRSCEKRRKMTLSRTTSGEEDPRKFAEERRLVLLLGSTSILFLVCVTPMVILNVTLSDDNLMRYPYQVFRAIANLLEVTNYSITFYIYCLFSEDFRNTLLRTLNLGDHTPARGMSKPAPPTTTTVTTQNTLKSV